MRKSVLFATSTLNFIVICLYTQGVSSSKFLKFNLVCSKRIETGFRDVTVRSYIGCCQECMKADRCACGAISVNVASGTCWLHDVTPDECYQDNVPTDLSWKVYTISQDTEADDWELIFRATAGNGDNVYKAWTTGENTTDVKPSSMQRGNSRHYRNTPNITEWNNVQYVKYSLFQTGREVAFITFNGTSSTYMDWFERSRVMDSSWCPIASGIGYYNYFSIVGQSSVARRFFVNQHYNSCPNDKGYTVVSDTDSNRYCLYDTHDSYPQFLYSVGKGPTQWDNVMYGKADYIAVFYTHG